MVAIFVGLCYHPCMFIRIKSTPNSPRKSVQIVASVRDGNKVRQKIMRHVGVAQNDEELAQLKELAEFIKTQMEEEHQPQLFPADEVAKQVIAAKKMGTTRDEELTVDLKQLHETQRTITGIHEVYGEIYQQIGFDRLWGQSSRFFARKEILKHITLARIAQPDSKRAGVAALERDFGIKIPLTSVYRMMDNLDDKAIDFIQGVALSAAQQMLGESLDVLFYDCTTLYFESFVSDELRQKGFSKDHKVNETQVLLALMVTREGLPIGYEVFPGATFEGHSLAPVLTALQRRYHLSRVVFVADRGLFSEDNLQILEQSGLEYVVGAKLKTQARVIKEQILSPDHYQELNEDTGYLTIDLEGKRKLVVSYSKKRARKDQHDRQKEIDKLKKKLNRSRKPKEFISASGYKRFLTVSDHERVEINEAAIEKATQWDGLHGVITNSSESVDNILSHYHELWRIEESFRIQKHDLKVRPVFHWNESRIRAHLAICFMAFCCVRHLEYRVRLQYQPLSPKVIRRELSHVQVSLLTHTQTGAVYAMPSSVSLHANKIYRVVGLKPTTTAYQVK